ncbi:MAG: nitrile hydratase subunit alpha [Actinomycetota bacterium]
MTAPNPPASDPGAAPAVDLHGEHLHGGDLARAQAVRAEALEALLVEAEVLSASEVDHYIETWNHRIGPMAGARVVARAWIDPGFRDRLAEDPVAAVAEVGVDTGRLERLEVVVNEPGVHNVVCCTLCSCYPWTVLGLPPSWYKSPEYRSRIVREPRQVLSEMGLDLDPDTTINVWDSSAELRYLVIPERPAGTDDLDEEALRELVTRDAMIGVAVVSPPDVTS